MLKIERISGKGGTRICLSGQLRSEHLSQVESEVERAGQPVALDLEEVDLVDIDGVRFLNECEAAGIQVQRNDGNRHAVRRAKQKDGQIDQTNVRIADATEHGAAGDSW